MVADAFQTNGSHDPNALAKWSRGPVIKPSLPTLGEDGLLAVSTDFSPTAKALAK